MASIITQNIGAAAASVAQPTQPVVTAARDQTARPVTQEQVQRASQEAARSLAQTIKNNGNNRPVQIPSRVEASFQAQRDKKAENGEEERATEEAPAAPEKKSRAIA